MKKLKISHYIYIQINLTTNHNITNLLSFRCILRDVLFLLKKRRNVVSLDYILLPFKIENSLTLCSKIYKSKKANGNYLLSLDWKFEQTHPPPHKYTKSQAIVFKTLLNVIFMKL